MKYLIFALAFVLAYARAGLLDKWNLDEPSVKFDSGTNSFKLSFDLHEDITEDNIRVKIFTAACQNPDDGTKGVEVKRGITVQNTNLSDRKGNFEFTLDIEELSKNRDVFDTSKPDKASLKICARYMLWIGGANEVNFIESILALNFDVSNSGFTFSSLVANMDAPNVDYT